MSGILFCIAGPSGGGKTSLVERFFRENPDSGLARVVTYTTRAALGSERDGIDYHFVTLEAFQRLAENGAFLEVSNDYGNWYGTPATILHDLAGGKHLLAIVDRSGVGALSKAYKSVCSIWITPSTHAALVSRLHGRGRDATEAIQARLEQSLDDMDKECEAPICRYRCLNDDFEQAYACLSSLIKSALEQGF